MKKKKMMNTINEFNEWIAFDYIYKSWTHEDYEDVTVYENRSGNIICIQRDNNGKIIDAWTE